MNSIAFGSCLSGAREQNCCNAQPLSCRFTRTNGSTGTCGVAEVSGSLLLANNNFYREFSDDPTVATGVQAMPQMHGSGMLRDLREAMSLGTAQVAALHAKVIVFFINSVAGCTCKSRAAGRFGRKNKVLSTKQCLRWWLITQTSKQFTCVQSAF
jgi:hypothetical protein